VRNLFKTSAITVIAIVIAGKAMAGALVKIDDDASLDIGFRIQTLGIVTEKDIDGDGNFESDTDFKVRRGRLRLKATITEYVTGFMQTEIGSGTEGSGLDWRLIDAWISLKPHRLCTLFAGQHMAPASRQNLTSSGALMTMDRPGMNYKTLTWGTRSVTAFANNTFADADAGLRGEVDVRDTGATLFGSGSATDSIHFKYYAGAYDGMQITEADEPRLAGRVQVNLFDAEPGYFNSSTYLGKKKTIGVGASFDTQPRVANSADKGEIDYTFYTADVFTDIPFGPGHVTVEAAYQSLDLDDATELDHDNDPLTDARDVTGSQGNGFYVQTGYFINNWQPWMEYEHWNSDSPLDKGTYDMYRAGLSYFIKGHNANIKAGFERLESAAPIGSTTEDTIDSFVLGCYVTY